MLRCAPAFVLLAACMGGSPPPIDPTGLPPTERTEDWEDWGPDQNIARRVTGRPILGPLLKSRLEGSTISGCYTNGETFSERLSTDGNVIIAGTGERVAKYKVTEDNLCFQYPDQPVACYTVTEEDGVLYFYTNGGYRLAAATTCPIPPGTKGLPDQ